MARHIISVSGLGSPSAAAFITNMNAALSGLLDKVLVSVQIVLTDALPAYTRQIQAIVEYEDGGSAMGAPFTITVIESSSSTALKTQGEAYFAANASSFISPIQFRYSDQIPNVSTRYLSFYVANIDAVNGAANYQVNGSSSVVGTSSFTLLDSLTALKAVAAPVSTVSYQMRGYWAAGDGGDGVFRWVVGDTTPDNGGTVIQLTAGGPGRFWREPEDYLNVRAFGAKGDGVTNDVTLINGAIASVTGGTVFIPKGVYAIAAPIQIHRGIRLLGAGPFDDTDQSSSKFVLKDGSNCAMLQTPSALAGGVSGSTHYMALENLCFDGNAAGQASETTNGAVQFWGAYIGSYIRNVFIKSARGPGFTLGGIGADVEIDHLWVNGCITTGYAFDTNLNLSGGARDGLLNMTHVYVENTSLVDGGDPRNNPAQRGKSIRLHRLVTVNVADMHVEACVYGVSVESCHVVNIASIHGAHIGNLTAADSTLVSIVDTDTRAMTIGAFNVFDYVTGCYFVRRRTGVSSNNIIQDLPIGALPYMVDYSMINDASWGFSRIMQSIITNQGGVQRVGGFSPTYWRMYSEPDSLTKYGFMSQADNVTSIGSNRDQPALAPKNFINVNSFGNAGDNISFSDPIYIAERNNAGFLTNGALFNLIGNPAVARGSNAYENLVSAVTGIVAPTLVTPLFAGQVYVDTAANQAYMSRGGSSPTEWMALNPPYVINQGGVARVGAFSPTFWRMYSESNLLTMYGYLKQADNVTSLGSNRDQPGLVPKDFITITSYGNPGDKLDFSVPVYIASRNNAGYLSTGALFNLVGNPAWSRGSNLYENIVSVVIGVVAPTSVTPLFAGQMYIDNVLNKVYVARGASSPTEWLLLN